MLKKCKVVLLSTENIDSPLWSYKERRLYYNQANFNDPDETTYYNIYILSDDGIKEVDWAIREFDNTLFKVNSNSDHKHYKCFKVIATTNSDLIKEGIASIDDIFIENYCNNQIEEVSVDYVDNSIFTYNTHIGGEIIIRMKTKEKCYPKLSYNGSVIIK